MLHESYKRGDVNDRRTGLAIAVLQAGGVEDARAGPPLSDEVSVDHRKAIADLREKARQVHDHLLVMGNKK